MKHSLFYDSLRYILAFGLGGAVKTAEVEDQLVLSCHEQLLKPSCASVRPLVGRSVGHVCEKVTFRVL